MRYPSFLLPHTLKLPGMLVLLLSTGFGLFTFLGDFQPSFLEVRIPGLTEFTVGTPSGEMTLGNGYNNLADEITACFILLSLMVLMFCKEKMEDELIAKMRLEAMYWAMACNLLILLVALFFLYDVAFFLVMVANIFIVPVLFLLRFHWVLHRLKKAGHEE